MDNDGCIKVIAWIVILAILGALVVGIGFVPERLVVDEVTGTVTDKYIKRYSDSDYFHVVVEFSDGTTEVFQNHDALWWWKWNSADVQQAIEMGKTYRFTVTGWRVPLLSWFRNIVDYDAPIE